MATIYPEHQRYHEAESDAERRLYPFLAELPDDHVVFRNRRWHVRSRSGGAPKPAEADFLIAHPDRGILVLEVKGGVIRRDVTTDRWYSNAALLDPDPFQQVQRTRYLLVEMLEAGPSSGIGFRAGEAVAFPDGFIDRSDVSDALLPERIIGGEELEHLDAAIERCFDAFGLHDKAATFGRRGVRALTEAVPGSVNVAAQGHRVLLTCFNAPLGGHIRSELGPVDGVDVMHFHLLCRVWADNAGVDSDRRADESDRDYWDARLPNLLTEAAAELDTATTRSSSTRHRTSIPTGSRRASCSSSTRARA
jgi:hypothetical protein